MPSFDPEQFDTGPVFVVDADIDARTDAIEYLGAGTPEAGLRLLDRHSSVSIDAPVVSFVEFSVRDDPDEIRSFEQWCERVGICLIPTGLSQTGYAQALGPCPAISEREAQDLAAFAAGADPYGADRRGFVIPRAALQEEVLRELAADPDALEEALEEPNHPRTLNSTHSIHMLMERKNVTVREDQAEWVDEEDVNLSQLVQDAIDEAMGPTDEELAEAYRANADHAKEVNEEWSGVSKEANEHLDDASTDR